MKINTKKLIMIIGEEYKKRVIFIFPGMLIIAFFEVLRIAVVLPFMKLALDIHSATESLYVTKIKSFALLSNSGEICESPHSRNNVIRHVGRRMNTVGVEYGEAFISVREIK